MSPSKIHLGEASLANTQKHCPIASWAQRSLRKPYEQLSPVVSAMGSNAIKYSACIALSFMVGIPKGRSFPFFFLICTRFNGCGRYPLLLNSVIAFIFPCEVAHKTWSTPAVFFPLLEVTRLTANALA